MTKEQQLLIWIGVAMLVSALQAGKRWGGCR